MLAQIPADAGGERVAAFVPQLPDERRERVRHVVAAGPAGEAEPAGHGRRPVGVELVDPELARRRPRPRRGSRSRCRGGGSRRSRGRRVRAPPGRRRPAPASGRAADGRWRRRDRRPSPSRAPRPGAGARSRPRRRARRSRAAAPPPGWSGCSSSSASCRGSRHGPVARPTGSAISAAVRGSRLQACGLVAATAAKRDQSSPRWRLVLEPGRVRSPPGSPTRTAGSRRPARSGPRRRSTGWLVSPSSPSTRSGSLSAGLLGKSGVAPLLASARISTSKHSTPAISAARRSPARIRLAGVGQELDRGDAAGQQSAPSRPARRRSAAAIARAGSGTGQEIASTTPIESSAASNGAARPLSSSAASGDGGEHPSGGSLGSRR